MKSVKKAHSKESEWTLTISAERGLLNIPIKELYQYKDLLIKLVHRDLVSQYKQTILGPLWLLLQPILTTTAFVILFGKIAGLSTNGIPQPVFYMAGVVLWSYFSEILQKISLTFVENEGLYSKVYFPRLISPLSVIVSATIKFIFQYLLLLLVIFYYMESMPSSILFSTFVTLPLILFIVSLFALSIGLCIASMTAKYRDLRHLAAHGTQAFMYVTPVVFSLSSVPEGKLYLVLLNPLAAIIEVYRYSLLGAGDLYVGWIVYSIVIISLMLVLSIIYFTRVEFKFMDTV